MPAMWIGAGASLLSGLMGSSSAKKAAKAQERAAQQQLALQREMYETSRADLAPWRGAGESALDRLQWYLGIGGTGSTNPAVTAAQNRLNAAQAAYNAASQGGGGGGYGYNAAGQAFHSSMPGDSGEITWRDGVRGRYRRVGYGGEGDANEFVFFPESGGGGGGGAGLQPALDELNAARAALAEAQAQPWDAGPGYGSLLRPFSLQDFREDPGYQFRMTEGAKGIERSAAARGMQLSGANLKDLNRFHQGLAAQEYQSAFSRDAAEKARIYNMLSGVSSSGQSAAAGQAGFAQNLASMGGEALAGAGNAAAAGIVGAGNAMQNALGGFGDYLSLQQIMRRGGGGGGGGGRPPLGYTYGQGL